MNRFKKFQNEKGKLGPYILLWLIGVPLPLLFLVGFFRGCH